MIDSADVNAYLREISGEDFTAKDFRTWAGTVLAAKALAEDRRLQVAPPKRSGTSSARSRSVAKRLGNTKAGLPQVLHPSGDPRRLHGRRHDRER